MKKISIVMLSLFVTITATAQIKKSTKTIKTFVKPAAVNFAPQINSYQNLLNVQMDSASKIFVVNKLNALKSNNEIIKQLDAQINELSAKESSELNMIELQSLISKRATYLQMTTGMMQSMDSAQKSRLQNIR